MGITFTNNWKNIADKLRSTFRTEFKGALPVYINDENVSTGGQYLQLDLASTSLSEKMVGCELREYTVSLSYIFQSPNVKKSSLDHVLRYTSRIEQLMQNNTSLSLTDSTAAVNCRIESTELQEGEDNSYLVSFDWKCQHLSGLSEVIDTTPTLNNTFSLNFDGSNDYVDCGTALPDITSGSFAIGGWFRVQSGYDILTDGAVTLFSRGDGSATSGYALIYQNSGGTPRIISFQKKASGYDYIAHNVTLTPDSWYHIAWVNGGTGVESSFYINGSQVVTKTLSSDIVSASSISFYIGTNSAANSSWEGNIDEVAVWNTALDADAVAAIYNSGTPTDLSSDSGDYDNSANLQGYWRMGDGTLDEYPLIADQVNPTLGSNLSVWSGETVSVGAYSGIENNTTVNLTSGKLYKISFTVSSYTSGSFRFRQPSGADAGVTGSGNGDYTQYITATNVNELNCDAFNLGFVGVISDYIVKEVQGNAGLMTNMVSGDIEEDTP
jgi:hypothetical protein